MESTRSTTDTLAAGIRRAINALPLAHRSELLNGELVDNLQDRYARLQDWAFVQGFALVKESSRPERWVLHCIHHHDQTKDCRKTEGRERKRAWTATQAQGTYNYIQLSLHINSF